ncbi:MAG: alpha/beta hydrolase [Flavisolibacter sp.]
MGLGQRLALNLVRTKFKTLSLFSKNKAAEKALQLFLTPQKRYNKDLPPIFKKAENLEFDLNDVKVRGFQWNHSSEKKALILHGFESSVANFDQYIKGLIEKGYEVLAFDAPAHGISEGKMIDVLIYKQMIELICKKYGPIHSFIAHSFGGLALALALESMEHDRTYKVVFIAPATETKTAIDNYFKLLKLNNKVRFEFDKLLTEVGGNQPKWYSISRAAEHIKASVLFLQDENDELTPLSDVLPIMNKKYPNFEFRISKGLGHRRIYKEAESYKTIMNFLSDR